MYQKGAEISPCEIRPLIDAKESVKITNVQKCDFFQS